MNSKEEKTDFVSSSKIEEMGKEKVVIEPKEEKILTPSEVKEKKSFIITYFILESFIVIATICVCMFTISDELYGESFFTEISFF